MKNKNFPFSIIVLTLVIMLIGPSLISEGMFMDGTIYAGIAKNLAHDNGSFWSLHFSKTVFDQFNEHPPLAMGLQSLFFRLLGDGIYTERLYSLFTFLITGIIMILIWRKITLKEHHSYVWLPILIWISMPVVTWSVANNMLENTMMIFTLASFLFFLKSFEKYRLIWLLLTGFMVFLGFLTKGFISLFTFSIPFWFYLFKRDYTFFRFITDSAVILFSFLISITLIYVFSPVGIESLKIYIDKQVIGSIEHAETVNSRFFILWALFQQLIPALILYIIVYFLGRKHKKSDKTQRSDDVIYILLFISLSGIIPIMISMKQSAFYLTAALGYIALSLSLVFLPHITKLIKKIQLQSKAYKIFTYFSLGLLIGCIVYSGSFFNKSGRDKMLLEDIHKIILIVPENSVIGIDKTMRSDWAVHAYFVRYAGISLDFKNNLSHNYLIVRKNLNSDLSVDYTRQESGLKNFDLYERIKD